MAYNENKNINENVILFDNGFKETIKTFTNKKIIQEKNNVNRWFNNEVRLMKKDKIIKYQTAKLKNTNQAWTNYKTKRNIYKVKIENEKNKYINNKINNADDQKQMWREIKDLVFKKKHNEIKNVIFNQVEYKDNIEIANQFNNYFVDSIISIRDSIENVQYENQINTIQLYIQIPCDKHFRTREYNYKDEE